MGVSHVYMRTFGNAKLAMPISNIFVSLMSVNWYLSEVLIYSSLVTIEVSV